MDQPDGLPADPFMAAPQPCLRCGNAVRALKVDPAERGASFAAVVPYESDARIMWRQIEIGVCAGCLIEAGNAGRVLQRTILWPSDPDGDLNDFEGRIDEVYWPAEGRFEAIVRGLAGAQRPAPEEAAQAAALLFPGDKVASLDRGDGPVPPAGG